METLVAEHGAIVKVASLPIEPSVDCILYADGTVYAVRHVPARYARFTGVWGCRCGQPDCTGAHAAFPPLALPTAENWDEFFSPDEEYER